MPGKCATRALRVDALRCPYRPGNPCRQAYIWLTSSTCGGDELLLIFPQIGEDAFRQRLTQLREAVHRIVLADAPELRLDISIGGAYRVSPLAEAIRQADQKMYEQKAAHAAERGQEL